MSTIAEQAVNRATAGEVVVIDYAGHDIKSGYIIQGPASARVEWTAPDAQGVATVAHMLGELTRPSAVLVVDTIGRDTVAVEQCQRVRTEREAHHLSRLRGAAQYYDVRSGQMKDVHTSAWIVRTPASAIAQELLGQSAWTYLADPVGADRPGETHQPGTAHHYHTRATAERAIRSAQRQGQVHAMHAEAIEVSA